MFVVTAPVMPSLLALTCFRGQIYFVWGRERYYEDRQLDIVVERVIDLVGATGTPHSDQGYLLRTSLQFTHCTKNVNTRKSHHVETSANELSFLMGRRHFAMQRNHSTVKSVKEIERHCLLSRQAYCTTRLSVSLCMPHPCSWRNHSHVD